jgi:hypothetical protein
MADINRDELPTVAAGRSAARATLESAQRDEPELAAPAAPQPQETPQEGSQDRLNAFADELAAAFSAEQPGYRWPKETAPQANAGARPTPWCSPATMRCSGRATRGGASSNGCATSATCRVTARTLGGEHGQAG